jgi:hypothetical protein
MYYQIKKNSPLGKLITELQERVKASRMMTNKWTLKQNDNFSSKGMIEGGYLAGKILGIHFKECPDGWCLAKTGYTGFFRPKKLSKNKKIIAQMESFPIISKEELNQLFGLKSKLYGDKYFRAVTLKGNTDSYFVTVPVYVDDWTPPTDMNEILVSKYLQLTQQKQTQS